MFHLLVEWDKPEIMISPPYLVEKKIQREIDRHLKEMPLLEIGKTLTLLFQEMHFKKCLFIEERARDGDVFSSIKGRRRAVFLGRGPK